MTGNEAVALGSIAGGCRFIAAYPMTPSTGIITYLASTSKRTGITAIQAEDEIAAVNMAVGASYTGERAMTATSGGGFSLMVEGISLAAMTELPLVVVLGQRPGPATGLPTRTEQGELLFALHCAHGEFPRFIFAPTDAASAFRVMRQAFDLSWKYRAPSIVLTDQYLADSYWTVPADTFAILPADESANKAATAHLGGLGFKTYALTSDGISPQGSLGSENTLVICDSDEHDEHGHLTEDLPTRAAMAEKRWRKFPLMEKEFAPPEIEGDKTSEAILVGWGTSATIAGETSKILSAKGLKSAFVKYEKIWPLAVNPALLDKRKKIVVIENNFTGQFARLLAEMGVRVSAKINRFDGLPFFPEELAQKISAGNL
ncbi:MAG: thiamine pyrophosphate-binding protein [Endomicrobiia bacterium]|nr:thiamine pyrophosphate-binding protein [Endomicrobiia bacterium]